MADFATKGHFRRGGPFSQPISQLRNWATVLRNGTRVPREGFVVAKIFAEGCFGLRNYFPAEGYFRSQPLISQRAPKGCEIISQQMAIFAGAYFGLRNFADH